MADILAAGTASGAEIIHIIVSARENFRDFPKDNPLWIMVRQQKSMVIGIEGAQLHELWSNVRF